MTLSETISLAQGSVLIYQKGEAATCAYAFVACWERRLDWDTFTKLYALYEDRASLYVDGAREQIEPVFIAKSIDNDVLRFIQEQANTPPPTTPLRSFVF